MVKDPESTTFNIVNILEVTIVQPSEKGERQSLDSENLELYQMVRIDQDGFDIQINFTDPQSISSGKVKDIVNVTFLCP
jgi:hypothetical protein